MKVKMKSIMLTMVSSLILLITPALAQPSGASGFSFGANSPLFFFERLTDNIFVSIGVISHSDLAEKRIAELTSADLSSDSSLAIGLASDINEQIQLAIQDDPSISKDIIKERDDAFKVAENNVPQDDQNGIKSIIDNDMAVDFSSNSNVESSGDSNGVNDIGTGSDFASSSDSGDSGGGE